MHLKRFATADAFLLHAETFLAAHEAEHCLLLGIATTLRQRTTPPASQPYLAVVTDETDAPIFAAIMTPPFNLILSRCTNPDALTLVVQDLQGDGWSVTGVLGPASLALHAAQQWQAFIGQSFRQNMAERIYRLEQVISVHNVPGRMRPATEADRALLRIWLPAFEQEIFHSVANHHLEERIDHYLAFASYGLYLWEDGEPTALAAYSGPTPHGMRIGPVYTPPEQRGHGYASALVAALSQHVLDAGRQWCFLFTDVANPTSNHIYQNIGYQPVMDVVEYRFD